MTKIGLYIVQFFSILVLLCVIFLDVKSDKEYDMHFNSDPLTAQYRIETPSASSTDQNVIHPKGTVVSSEGKTNGKFNIGKHKSFESILPFLIYQPRYNAIICVSNTPVIHPDYHYLFFKEINPPPPNWC